MYLAPKTRIAFGLIFSVLTAKHVMEVEKSGNKNSNVSTLIFPSDGNVLKTNDVLKPSSQSISEDSHLTTICLLQKYGYPAEVHYVYTEDGYILEIHRIPKHGAIPVLLVHGVLDSSATWVLMGPNQGLGYYLYDNNYDIWMVNVRGNTYSRNHTRLNPNQDKFWDFTLDEIGRYDVPATIDYILDLTGKSQLHYVGHSQGTTIFWIMCSEKPEYNQKVQLMQALGPVAFLKHTKSYLINFMANFQNTAELLLKLSDVNEFLPNNEFLSIFKDILCAEKTIAEAVCLNVIFSIMGYDSKQMNETMLPVMLGHVPAGASTKQMVHYAQLRRSKQFLQYNYGPQKNLKLYNSITPPSYKLNNVRCKVVLHYSNNDWLAPPADVDVLNQHLPNVLTKRLVDFRKFNHLDFVWGIDARDLLYRYILDFLAQYSVS